MDFPSYMIPNDIPLRTFNVTKPLNKLENNSKRGKNALCIAHCPLPLLRHHKELLHPPSNKWWCLLYCC